MLGTGSLIATPVMHRLGGPRLCMVMGSVFDTLWILASVLPAIRDLYENKDLDDGYTPENRPHIFFYSNGFIYFLTTITSILGGLGEAVQWVAQGKYISDCAGETTRGFFFGYFWAFYMASQVIGNLLAGLVL